MYYHYLLHAIVLEVWNWSLEVRRLAVLEIFMSGFEVQRDENFESIVVIPT
jgi:hypothetical protein